MRCRSKRRFSVMRPSNAGFGALQRQCEPTQRGPHARHDELPVPTLIVDVQRGVPGQKTESDRRRERAEAAERLRAEQRAAAIAGAVAEIKTVLDDTQAMLRHKQYDAVRERLEKLTELFAPLDALAVTGSEAELPPAEVTVLRARFEAQRSELGSFRDRAFGHLLRGAESPRETPGRATTRSCSRRHKSWASRASSWRPFTRSIADQLEQRLARAEEAKRAAQRAAAEAVERRCGPLPTAAWREVQAYLAGLARAAGVMTRLDECFTPRLSDARRWSAWSASLPRLSRTPIASRTRSIATPGRSRSRKTAS